MINIHEIERGMTPNPTRQQVFLLAEKAGFKFAGDDRNEDPCVIGHDGNQAQEVFNFALLIMDYKQQQANEWRNKYEGMRLEYEKRCERIFELREQMHLVYKTAHEFNTSTIKAFKKMDRFMEKLK